MDLGIKGKIALVTGASAGLGLATAIELAREGARVAINSRSEENLEKAGKLIKVETGYFPYVAAGDLSRDGAPQEIIKKTTESFGPIDILVGNAGGPPSGKFLDHSVQTWKDAAELTLLSAVNLAREVIDGMADRGWGRIIFITSLSVKQPIDNLILSNTMRAGVAGFAKSISNQFAGKGVTVNTVMPGYTDTERLKSLAKNISSETGKTIEEVYSDWESSIPAGRVGKPEELAALITFLASEKAAYITGSAIACDGGAIKYIL